MNRSRVPLILAVLAGVLAMHGLGMACPSGPAGQAHMSASAPMPASPSSSVSGVWFSCPDDDDGMPEHSGGHTDQLCASAAVPGGPVPPVLATALLTGTVQAGRASDAASDSRSERAPPTLSELQLLRI